jgi:polysaccharide chain length determinant protein (PEP-CTERM system associated)
MRDFKSLTPVDHLRLVWRRRWYFVLTAVLVTSAGVVYAFRAPRIYKSETRILVESAFVPEEYVRPAMRTTNEDRIDAIREQVQSRTFLERLIEEFQLFGYGQSPSFEMDYAVSILRRNIQVMKLSTNTFTVSFRATSPEAARDVTRRVSDILIQSTVASQKTRAIDADQFLEDQMRQAEADLAAHEEKIKQFKNAHLGELPEQSAANLASLSQLNSQFSANENLIQDTRDRRKLLELRLQEQKQLSTLSQTAARMESLMQPAVGEEEAPPDPAIQQLAAKKIQLSEYSAKYTPRHPDVVRLAREISDMEQQLARGARGPEATNSQQPLGAAQPSRPERTGGGQSVQQERSDLAFNMSIAQIQAEMENLDNEVGRRLKERDDISRQIKLYQSRLNLAPSLEQELLALNREHEVLNQQYTNLKNRKFSAQLATSVETSKKNETYKVIDEANLPEKPESPNRTLLSLIGMAAGIGTGLGMAYLREYLDTTLSTGEEIQAALNLPVLAQFPEISSKRTVHRHRAPRRAKSA